MLKNKRTILSTRPLNDAIIQKAAEQDIHIDCLSFIYTNPIQNETIAARIRQLAQQQITAVFTSMNAVEAMSSYLAQKPSWKIFCIGNTTKELVSATFGNEAIEGTANYAAGLAEKIREKGINEVYFFCGDQRRDELPFKLSENNIAVEEIVVYQTLQMPHLLQQDYDGILFYSPSAVYSFFSVNTVSEDVIIFAIGETTASAVESLVKNKIVLSESPGKENLAATMMEYFMARKTIN